MNHKPKPWKVLKETPYADCKIFNIVKRTLLHPDGRKGDFFVNETNNWVQAIALTPDKKIVMVNQFRFGALKNSLEFPGGVIDEGESPARAAKRELLEETGYAGDKPVLLARISPNPAIQSNYAYIFLIKNCKKVSGLNLDENEEIQIFLHDENKLDSLVREGKITHSIAIAALHFFQKYIG